MLRKLRIEHLVLVDSCEICLQPGFHVITGETGSGKSVLLSAIGLLLGEKAELSAIRHGEKMAVIEGEFDIPSSALDLLAEVQIDLEESSCTIRRELLSSGKTRAFIDGHLIPVGFLKRLAPFLIEISDQHACLSLKDPETPRRLVDTYGCLGSLVDEFQQNFSALRALTEKRGSFLSEEPLRAKEIEHLQTQIDEINESNALTCDDAALFRRLSALEHSRELFEGASSLVSEIESGKNPLQHSLFRLSQRAERLSTLDASLASVAELLSSACSSSKEASHDLQRYLSSLDHSDDERMHIEAKLKQIDSVKRKYGLSCEEIASAKSSMEERLRSLKGRDDELDLLEKQIHDLDEACDRIASVLTNKREAAAHKLAQKIEAQLHELNMPKAIFDIEVSPAKRSATGDNTICFFCTPNVGEKRIGVSDGASGGELARVFLSFQAVMADYFSVPTILFDEIDASIGGMTAHAVGKILATMGEKRQVFAVTHFVQVASKAHCHFTLFKKEQEGRTVTCIHELCSQEARDIEHQRMLGRLQ